MKRTIVIALVLTAIMGVEPRLAAQTCEDEDGMAQGAVQSAAELVETVKKESEASFEAKFHQKTCLSKLTFAIASLDEAVQCRSQTGDGAAATPEQTAASQAKKESDTKLRARLDGYRKALKAADDPKTAKTLIEKFNLPK